MRAEVEVITVAYAKQLLEQNPSNRRVSKALVTRYAADMKAGRWTNNGQGIVLSPEGELLDGQHRMRAVVLSQTSVAMLVVRGVPRDAFATLDSGKPRTLGDVLSIENTPHAATVAGIARIGFNYASGQHFNYQATKAAMADFVHAHPYAVEVAAQIHKATPGKFPKIPLSATVFLGNERRLLDDEAEKFIDGVLHGEGLWKGDARLTLREWVAAQRVKGRGTVRSYALFAATVRAWNAYAQGRELSFIKGVEMPTQRNLPIFGFERSTYADVPNLAPKAERKPRSNLPSSLATPRLEVAA